MERPTLLPRLWRFTVIAIWLGLLTGMLEAGIVVFRHKVLHRVLDLGPYVVWMAPLGELVMFATIGATIALGTWLLGRLVPSFPAFGLLVLGLLTVSGLTIALWMPWLAELPGLLLSAGVATQVALRARTREAAWYRTARRWVLPLALVVAGGGLATEGWRRWTERRAIAALPEPPADAPNILFIVLDAVSARWLTLYGYDRPTSPRIEALARSGVVFERAYATSSWTLPSHGSMFTGRYPHELEADWWVPLDRRFPTLAERLGSVGYVTGGFPANQAYGRPDFGLARGFLHYETYPVTWQEVVHNFAVGRRLNRSATFRRFIGYWEIVNRKDAARVSYEALRWVRRAGSRPFFAFLNYFDTHEPYYPRPPFDSVFSPGLDELPRGTVIPGRTVVVAQNYKKLTPTEVRQARDAYDGALAFVDERVGWLLDELERGGTLENTIVVLTADHGEWRGEEGRWGHGRSLDAEVLRVPLIVRYPGVLPAGVRIAEPVTLRDLPATMVALAGLESRISFPGTSLTSMLERDSLAAPHPSRVLASMDFLARRRPRARSVLVDRFQFIQYEDGREELYDVNADPLELRDLIADEAAASRLAIFRAVLDSAWADSAFKPWSVQPEARPAAASLTP